MKSQRQGTKMSQEEKGAGTKGEAGRLTRALKTKNQKNTKVLILILSLETSTSW